ncbi:MAG: hypothetical protein R6V44_03200 [Paracoccaceae bacterium]
MIRRIADVLAVAAGAPAPAKNADPPIGVGPEATGGARRAHPPIAAPDDARSSLAHDRVARDVEGVMFARRAVAAGPIRAARGTAKASGPEGLDRDADGCAPHDDGLAADGSGAVGAGLARIGARRLAPAPPAN